MAKILKAICLLLIGGGIGAFVAGGGNRAMVSLTDVGQGQVPAPSSTVAFGEASQAAPGAHAFPPAEVTEYVQLATHQALAIRTSGAKEPSGQRPDRSARVRLAQAAGRMSDAQPPLPSVRPLPVRAGAADTVAKGDEQSAQARLAEAIQKELKRVGCYAGNIDGDWGAETRRAMRAFNDRVNATLPVEQPDYILLTLLQGHSARACGAACPPGQEISDGGKCLPRSVIAEQRRRLKMERAAATSQAARAGVALSGAPDRETSMLPADHTHGNALPSSGPQREADRAEIEQQRIKAAEERRRQIAIEAAAHAEQEKLARREATEKARIEAEARRRDEIAELAARAAKRAAAAAETRPTASVRSAATAGPVAAVLPPPLPVRPSQAFRQQVVASPDLLRPEIEAATSHKQKASRRQRQRQSREARYAGRFMPPPTYRVGRLRADRVAGMRMFASAPRPAYRSGNNPQAIFRELQHRMP